MVCGLQVGTGPKAIANDAVLMYVFFFCIYTVCCVVTYIL